MTRKPTTTDDQDARRAALNLMEDAVAAREATAKLNAELRETVMENSRLAAIVAAADDAIYSKDFEGIIQTWNAGAQRLFGYTAEEAIGAASTLLIPPDRLYEEPDILRRVRSGESIDQAHTVRRRKDGRLIDISRTVSPIRDAAGVIVGAAMTARDITERKQVEDERQRSLERLRTLFDASPVGAYLVDDALRIRLVNRKAEPVFGDIGELIGRDFVEVIHILWHKEYADEIVGLFRHTLDTGEPYHTSERSEDRLDRGVAEHYEWQIHRIVLPDGRFGVVCFFIDLAARMFVERALRDSELRYRRLFETAKDGILILDSATGQITDANAFMSALVGVKPEELLGKELFQIGMFKDIDENKRAFDELQQNGYIRYDHLPLQNKNGETVDVEFIGNVYKEGNALVAQCNVRDISQRVTLEKRILEQADLLADESRRKDEFLAMLSHELRNPLGPIHSALHLLKVHERGDDSPIRRHAQEVIERQVTNLTKLVNDLMDVSRAISGRIRLDLRVIDLNQVIEHARAAVLPFILERKHELSMKTDSDPVWVNGDATRLEQIMINLLNNAAKYTEDGGKIEVICEQLHGHGLVRVCDNGIGIDKVMLQQVFELFAQADRSLDRAGGGMGIGLSLARRLVDLHGGTIEALSDGPGLGCEVIMKLPLVPPVEMPPVVTMREALQRSPDGLRVLVVDDNLDQVEMLASSLRLEGYVVQSALTGPDALDLALQWRPDIVLLDIGLPGLDGYEVARRLRSAPNTQKMRLIALTGYGRDSDISLAKKAGFNGHIVKPFDIDEIEKIMVDGSNFQVRG